MTAWHGQPCPMHTASPEYIRRTLCGGSAWEEEHGVSVVDCVDSAGAAWGAVLSSCPLALVPSLQHLQQAPHPMEIRTPGGVSDTIEKNWQRKVQSE